MIENRLTVANLIYKDVCVGYRLFSVNSDLKDCLDVYDVSKEIGDSYELGLLSDRNILLIPDGKLLVSKDEIDNDYVVKDISEDSNILTDLLNIAYNDDIVEDTDTEEDEIIDSADNEDNFIDEIDEMYEEDDDVNSSEEDGNNFIDEIDDMYYEEEEEEESEVIENTNDTDNVDFVDEIDDMYYEDDDEDDDIEVSVENTIKNGIVDYLCSLYLKPSRVCDFKGARGIPVNIAIEVGNELRKINSNLSIDDVSNGVISKMDKEGYDYKSNDEFCNGMTEGTFIERL